MTIKSELEALKQDDFINPENVVAWARKHKTSALHKSLEWDDTKAGHQWRLMQVRQLVRIHIVSEAGVRTAISLSVDRTADKGYRMVSDVMSAPDLREIALKDALAEVDRIEAKYNHLKELAGIWEEKNRVRARVTKTAERDRAPATAA